MRIMSWLFIIFTSEPYEFALGTERLSLMTGHRHNTESDAYGR